MSPAARALRQSRNQALAALGTGAIFGVGLVLSGMTLPSKVIGFLDFFGDWDPSLALVMGGAIAVHAVVFRLVARRASPLFAQKFALPTRRDLDPKLLAGAAIFGAGWGLGGFCPGPGLTSLAGFSGDALLFIGAMLVGMLGVAQLEKLQERAKAKEKAKTAEAARVAADASPHATAS